jgi:UDP-N-acetylmuramoylalanine--D-glutamate ligase
VSAARPPLPPGPYLVVGLARSGQAALRALEAQGEQATGVDRKTGGDGLAELPHARVVVKSPGVPREAPVIAAARERAVPVLGEVELAWRLLPNDFVAVTGTNGKTTTVELIGHIHREAGLPVAVAGNVGTAVSSLVGALGPEAVVVCETSSFQLEDTVAFAPEGAVLLNLAPDHLDRHGTFEAYRAAKLQVFARQGNDDVAVAPVGLGIEDLGGCARRVCFGAAPEADLADRAGQLWWGDEPLIAVGDIRLRGAHNRANAMAAAAICLARGVEADAVRAGLRTFAGVEHRLEEVATLDGVLYVNDSKATNVDSTLVALRSFEAPVHLILGGRGKGQDFTPLRGPVAERCADVYLIGEAAPALAAAVGEGRDCGDLEHAVAAARAAARPGDVVLLSPACASYDQYGDFEARGRHFKELVA